LLERQLPGFLLKAKISSRLSRSHTVRGILTLTPGEEPGAELSTLSMQARLSGLAEAVNFPNSQIPKPVSVN
jgi:hypothetical protein